MSAPTELGLWSIPLVVFGRAILMGTPYLYVSLGECITEKSGRVNLGLEGNLFLGALTGFAVSYHSGSPWLGVLAAGCVGILMGIPPRRHLQPAARQRRRRRHRADDVRHGSGVLSWATSTSARRLTAAFDSLGRLVVHPQIQAALKVNVLFVVGVDSGARAVVDARQHPLGSGAASGRRKRRSRRRDGLFGQSYPHRGDGHRRLLGRRRRQLSVAVFPRLLERTDFVRPGTNGGGPGDLRPLEPDLLSVRVAAVRRRRFLGRVLQSPT